MVHQTTTLSHHLDALVGLDIQLGPIANEWEQAEQQCRTQCQMDNMGGCLVENCGISDILVMLFGGV